MKDVAWTAVLLIINGVLVTIVGFFLKHVLQELLSKLTLVETAVNTLNTTMAVIVTKQSHHKDKFASIDKNIKRLDIESEKARERIHKIVSDMNGMHLKCELAHEHFCKE